MGLGCPIEGLCPSLMRPRSLGMGDGWMVLEFGGEDFITGAFATLY